MLSYLRSLGLVRIEFLTEPVMTLECKNDILNTRLGLPNHLHTDHNNPAIDESLHLVQMLHILLPKSCQRIVVKKVLFERLHDLGSIGQCIVAIFFDQKV